MRLSRSFCYLAGGFVLTVGAMGQSASAAELTINRFTPTAHPMFSGTTAQFTENVKKASNGAIKVIIPSASMAPAPRQWDMVVKGVADVAITANVFQRKRLVLMQMANLPFVTETGESSSVALWRTYKKFFEPLNEYKGVKLLSLFVHSGSVLQSSANPIRSAADLTNVKIRTSPGMSKAVTSALGATAVTSPGVKIFEYVSKGTVDGLVSTTGSINTYKIGRYLKHQTDIPGKLGNVSFSFFMNGKTWAGLSADEKKAVEAVSYEPLSRTGGRAWDVQDQKGDADIKQYNIQRITADAAFLADMRKRLQFIQDDWIKSAKKQGLADPKAAIEFYVAEAKKLR